MFRPDISFCSESDSVLRVTWWIVFRPDSNPLQRIRLDFTYKLMNCFALISVFAVNQTRFYVRVSRRIVPWYQSLHWIRLDFTCGLINCAPISVFALNQTRFYVWIDGLCFTLISISRLNGRDKSRINQLTDSVSRSRSKKGVALRLHVASYRGGEVLAYRNGENELNAKNLQVRTDGYKPEKE